jgi:hypothetical protein
MPCVRASVLLLCAVLLLALGVPDIHASSHRGFRPAPAPVYRPPVQRQPAYTPPARGPATPPPSRSPDGPPSQSSRPRGPATASGMTPKQPAYHGSASTPRLGTGTGAARPLPSGINPNSPLAGMKTYAGHVTPAGKPAIQVGGTNYQISPSGVSTSLRAKLLSSSALTSKWDESRRKAVRDQLVRLKISEQARAARVKAAVVASGAAAFTHVPHERREAVRKSFVEGRAEAIRLEEDLVVYRHTTDKETVPGRYFAPRPYIKAGNARRYLALPNQNTAHNVQAWILPKGTIVLRGPTADKTDDPVFGTHTVGGGIQIYVPDVRRIRQIEED